MDELSIGQFHSSVRICLDNIFSEENKHVNIIFDHLKVFYFTMFDLLGSLKDMPCRCKELPEKPVS